MAVRQATPEELKQLGVRTATPEEIKALNAPEDRSFGQTVAGVGETALTLATGMVAAPIAGLVGLGTNIAGMISGDDDVLATTVERINRVQDALTFAPKTEAGQDILQTVATPFELLHKGAVKAGEVTQDVTGSPIAATAVQTAIEMAPGGIGIRPRPRRVKEDVARLKSEAGELGIELGAAPAKKTEQIQAAGRKEVGGRTSRAEPLADVATKVQIARQIAKEHRDLLYAEARGHKAFVPDAQRLPGIARESLRDFDVETMPIVQKRLKELDKLSEFEGNPSVKLNALEDFRTRLNRNRPAATDLSQARALDILKGQVDEFVQSKFNADMIKGDPIAVAKWKNARKAHERYMKTFKEDKVIRQLSEKAATPEEMRNWLYGASVTGAKKQSASTVRRLKEIIGEDSPEFRALRQDALLDVMGPLLRETPNFKQFVKNYDRLIRENKSLVNELFPESATPLRKLRDFANASDNLTPRQRQVRLERMGAVALLGHGIARAALKVNLAERAFNLLRRVPERSRRRQFMGDILGYDPFAPVIRPSAVGLPAAGQAAIDEVPTVVN